MECGLSMETALSHLSREVAGGFSGSSRRREAKYPLNSSSTPGRELPCRPASVIIELLFFILFRAVLSIMLGLHAEKFRVSPAESKQFFV